MRCPTRCTKMWECAVWQAIASRSATARQPGEVGTSDAVPLSGRRFLLGGAWLEHRLDWAAQLRQPPIRVRMTAVFLRRFAFVYRKPSAPGTTRTCDPQVRSLMLYPTELRTLAARPGSGVDPCGQRHLPGGPILNHRARALYVKRDNGGVSDASASPLHGRSACGRAACMTQSSDLY